MWKLVCLEIITAKTGSNNIIPTGFPPFVSGYDMIQIQILFSKLTFAVLTNMMVT